MNSNNNNNAVKPLKEKYQYRFKEWCETSTSHGIPNIARGRNWFIRIMWTLFFLASFGYCTYVIVKSIIDFLKYETTVSIKKIQELPAVFPAVTICNINPFNEEEISDFLIYVEQATGNDFSCLRGENIDSDSLQACFSTNDTNSLLEDFIEQMKRIVANIDLNGTIERKDLGYDLEDHMLISCKYNRKYCDSSNFTKFWSNQYGNCFTFNSGKANHTLLRTSEEGPNYGLVMELVLKRPNVQPIYEYRTGLYVVVHNQSEVDFSLNDGINIPTGSDVFVGVNRVFNEKQESPYSDCLKEMKSDKAYAQRIFGFIRGLNVTYYDQNLCFDICYQDKLIDRCNCSDTTTPAIRGAYYCEDSSEIECMENYASEFSTSDINKLCDSACPQGCSTIEYDLELNSATFPSRSYLKLLYTDNQLADYFPTDPTQLEAFASEGFLRVRINYEANYYTAVTENPSITVEGLLGNIGGQLGLFIGISFLSFIELLELASEFVVIFFQHRKEVKQAKRMRPSPLGAGMYPFNNFKY